MKKSMFKREFTDSWDFRNENTKEFTHGYHTYPAVMIPQIARKLLEDYNIEKEKSIGLVFDPYMGSGTTLVESIIMGYNVIGTDLNPLARLISKVKCKSYDVDMLEEIYKGILEQIKEYNEGYHVNEVNIPEITNPEFWYSDNALCELSYLDSIISNIKIEYQDFFKLCLAECIREVSFTRNGEFKRYRMAEDKLAVFKPDTFKLFQKKVKRNMVGNLELSKVKQKGVFAIHSFNTVDNIPSDILSDTSIDIVVTSPPYGDSKTTVAYGQFSRWANEWFDFENAKKLDSFLMGGQKKASFTFETESIAQQLNEIKRIDEKRYLEVLYFLDDYFLSMQNVAQKVKSGGRVCYVVGNRTVKGVQIPLDYFTAETFERFGFKHITTYVRSIPNKRMPSKTSPSNKKGENVSTMVSEYIVILDKN